MPENSETITVTSQVMLPPAPKKEAVYCVEFVGVKDFEPLRLIVPTCGIVAFVALVLVQVSVMFSPGAMDFLDAVSVQVGAFATVSGAVTFITEDWTM